MSGSPPSTLATPAANAAPTAAIPSVIGDFMSRLHAVGPGGGRGPSVAKNEQPPSTSSTSARMGRRHETAARVARYRRAMNFSFASVILSYFLIAGGTWGAGLLAARFGIASEYLGYL